MRICLRYVTLFVCYTDILHPQYGAPILSNSKFTIDKDAS